jgi:hypothetical protein
VSRRRDGRKHPLGRLGQMPTVAPHHACIRCFKADTNRVFVVIGDAMFAAASLVAYAGIDAEEAINVIASIRGEQPITARAHHQIRLCRGCAKLTDAPVMSEATLDRVLAEGGQVRGVVQPPAAA